MPVNKRRTVERQFKRLLAAMWKMHSAKNHDYATPADPLANLRVHGAYGIVVRLTDKLLRLQSFFDPATGHRKYAVKNEKVVDTCLDAAIYNLLLVILHGERKVARRAH